MERCFSACGSDLLVQSADLLLDQLQVRQCHFHELTVDRVELGAGAQRVAQLCRCGTQALIGQGGQSRRIRCSFGQCMQHPSCTGAEQVRNQTGQLDMGFFQQCPGDEESAGVNRSKRAPKGNRQMRRILYQAANAAVKHKGSIFEIVYRRFVLRLGHNKTIGAIAHRLCQLIWIILHNGGRYEERGPAVSEKSKRLRTTRMIRTLRKPWLPSRTFGKSGMRNPIFDPVVSRPIRSEPVNERFYEKVIKVKADVAALLCLISVFVFAFGTSVPPSLRFLGFLLFLFLVAFATFPQKILR
ncbi:MAG: hypothetical protein DMG69_04320 [Acidobacteria bacterium]|nr:MAG: hypothetical protein DMG69_04320 [Acidobacteriota bacterium]